eukprot:4825988-Pyramimonas_sp.AAC.1
MASAKRMCSGVAQHLRDHWSNVQLEKVKAHQDVQAATDDSDRFVRQGNEWADSTAKEAALLHPLPSESVLEGLDRDIVVARAVGRLGAKLLALWPRLSLGPHAQFIPPPPAERRQGEDKKVHQWSWVGSYWQCAECLRGKRGRPS